MSDVVTGGWRSIATVGWLVSSLGVVVLNTSVAGALMTASLVVPVNPNAATDAVSGSSEKSVAVAGSEDVFVATYCSEDSLGGTIGGEGDILAVRSMDGGRTWSAAVSVDSEAATDSGPCDRVALSFDGDGVWLAVWPTNGGPLVASRSLDNGLTWSPRTTVGATGGHPDMDSTGMVSVVVWMGDDDLIPGSGSDLDVFYSRSTDGGVSWSPVASLDPNALSDVELDLYPRVATDGHGNWVAVWLQFDLVYAVRSADDGATWSPAVFVGPSGDFGGGLPGLATDGVGKWIVVWEAYGQNIAGMSGIDVDTAYSVSSDNGATWSTPKALSSDAETDEGSDFEPRVEAINPGEFQAAWYSRDSFGGTTGRDDSDIFGCRTLDGGEHWTPRALLNSNGNRDSTTDSGFEMAMDGSGNSVIAWFSRDSLDGTIGDDSDILSSASHADCPTAPREDCVAASARGGSRLTIKNGPGGNDRLLWSWSGEDTLPVDLGDPTTSGGYALCLYDKVGPSLRAVFEIDAIGAAQCNVGGSACWSTTKSGFRYKDPINRNGATKALSASAATSGSAKFKMTGSGPTLSLPTLPLALSPDIRVQLLNTQTGACWTSMYSTALRNDTEGFKARSD